MHAGCPLFTQWGSASPWDSGGASLPSTTASGWEGSEAMEQHEGVTPLDAPHQHHLVWTLGFGFLVTHHKDGEG